MARNQKKRSGKKLPWGKILLWVILVVGISGFFDAEVKAENALLLTAGSGVGLLICYRDKLFGKKQNAAPEASATPASSTSDKKRVTISIEGPGRTLSYRLAGVTFEGRQKWLEQIEQKQEAYEAVSYELEPFEWEGDPACRVLAYLEDEAEPVNIGNIPATAAATVYELIDRVTGVDVEVYGGPEYEGDDKSYGARVTIAYK